MSDSRETDKAPKAFLQPAGKPQATEEKWDVESQSYSSHKQCDFTHVIKLSTASSVSGPSNTPVPGDKQSRPFLQLHPPLPCAVSGMWVPLSGNTWSPPPGSTPSLRAYLFIQCLLHSRLCSQRWETAGNKTRACILQNRDRLQPHKGNSFI